MMYVNALERMRREGWTKGTILESSMWGAPNRIIATDTFDGVKLVSANHAYRWVKSLPIDTHLAGATCPSCGCKL